MKLLLVALVALFLVLQYKLWFGPGGVVTAGQMKQELRQQQAANATLQAKNGILLADIKLLKQNPKVIEAEARSNLGMIKRGETFYQLVS